MTPAAIAECFRRFKAENPQPTTELEYSSTFELLIAVILSAQATDKGVNKATRRLFPAANTPAAILALGEDGLKEYIKTIGLYNSKAANILKTCQILIDDYHGVILNTAYRQPVMAVDTHIFRVANRTGIAPGKTVRAVEDSLMQRVPPEYRLDAHHWLILHGRYICIARKPRCTACLISDLCDNPQLDD